MTLPLKMLSRDAIPRAIEKADRYRLLNEPLQAESICLDILNTDPENQTALIILVLALTDQFSHAYKMGQSDPKDILARLKDNYSRAYYTGIVAERRAQALLDKDAPDAKFQAHDFLSAAMRHFEKAATLNPPGNDDALLRWNTCARLMNTQGVQPRGEEAEEPFLE